MVGHKNKNTFLDNENFLQIDIHFCKQMTSKFRIKKIYIYLYHGQADDSDFSSMN